MPSDWPLGLPDPHDTSLMAHLGADFLTRCRPELIAHLTDPKKRKLPVPTRDLPCPACGLIVRDHPRCAACGSIASPGHLVAALAGDLCPPCRDARARNASRRRAG